MVAVAARHVNVSRWYDCQSETVCSIPRDQSVLEQLWPSTHMEQLPRGFQGCLTYTMPRTDPQVLESPHTCGTWYSKCPCSRTGFGSTLYRCGIAEPPKFEAVIHGFVNTWAWGLPMFAWEGRIPYHNSRVRREGTASPHDTNSPGLVRESLRVYEPFTVSIGLSDELPIIKPVVIL